MRNDWRTFLGCVAASAICYVLCLASAPAARAGGWVHQLPPNRMKPESGRRNHVFYVGEPVVFTLEGQRLDRFEVRDYWGNLVDQGPATESVTLKPSLPGWYKLYVYAKKPDMPAEPPKDPAKAKILAEFSPIWGDVVGGTTFVIMRNDPHFPRMPEPSPRHGLGDQVLRAVTGMGPQRYAAFADKPEESIKTLAPDIEIDKRMYLPFDPIRPRQLFIAMPNGTKEEEGVRKIVEHFEADVRY
ncbi:MAG TPA: hypothetical protein VE890_11605 [Thermoguttaceae bacterium]|nr:hypothetical protein [Thermoguttaceae bacterium]